MLLRIYPTRPKVAEAIYSHIHFGTMMAWRTTPMKHKKPLAELYEKSRQAKQTPNPVENNQPPHKP